MDETIKYQISSLEKENKYKELYNLFVGNHLDFSYFSYFLALRKRQKGFSLDADFWQSDFSSLFVKEIVDSTFRFSYFKSLFSSNKKFNPALLNGLNLENCDLFIEQFKLHKAFQLSSFMDFLSTHHNNKLKEFYKELEVIKRLDVSQKQTINDSLKLLSEFSFVKVLNTICNWQHPLDMNINIFNQSTSVQIINILHQYFESIQSSFTHPVIDFEEIEKFYKEVYEKDEETSKIEIIITNLYNGLEDEIIVDLYCSGNLSFEFVSSLGSKLISNHNYEQYQFNDLKVKIDERYHDLNELLQIFQQPYYKKTELYTSYYRKYFSFYGDFATYFQTNKGFDLFDVLFVLRTIVDSLNPEELISIWRFDDFLTIFERSFSHIANFKSIFKYLVLDIKDDTSVNIIYRPLIRVGDNIFTINGLLKNRNWNVIYLNRIIDELEPNLIGNIFEQRIPVYFKENGYEIATKRDSIVLANGESTDIDVLAYKNNLIFVVQAKFSKVIEDFKFIPFIENKRLSEDASKQMDISMKWIFEKWDEVCKDLNINKSVEEIKIIPLIVANYYDGDGKLYNKKYPKISLLQLHAILNNRVDELDVVTPLWDFALSNRKKVEIPESNYPIVFCEPTKLEEIWFRKPNMFPIRERIIY